MRCGWRLLILSAALGLPACLFAAEAKTPELRMQTSNASAAQASRRVVREIDDPATGKRWLLESNPAHPGGPGRLVLASGTTAAPGKHEGGEKTAPANAQLRVPSPLQVIIRAGDRLVVEQNTPVIEARLEAVALSPARKGAAFQARLKIGGKVVRAVALAPGRASLAPAIGVWR